jgi:hypothetical protein
MAINRPVTKTIISTPDWGIPITDEVNRLTAWQLAQVPTVWYTLVLSNGWSHAAGQTASYRKIGDMVQLRGRIQGGTMGVTVATLPSGFRPPITQEFGTASIVSGGWTVGGFSVGTDGTLFALAGSNSGMVFNGIAFSVTP